MSESCIFPITSDAEYKAALAVVAAMLRAEPQIGSVEYTHAMALVDLIDAYETAQGWNLAEPSEGDLVEFRRDQTTTIEFSASTTSTSL